MCSQRICVDVNGKILLGKRTDNHKWAYAGGSVEIDEYAEVVQKGIVRERGFRHNLWSSFLLNSGPETHYIYPNGDEVSNFEIVYLCSEWEGEPKMQDGEMEELRFFTVDEIDLDEISPPTRGVMEEYVRRFG